RGYERTKALMFGDEATWQALAGKLAAITGTFLSVQVEAGAGAVQLFDSWVGALSPQDYRRYALEHSRSVLARVASVPRAHFGVGTGELLHLLGEAGAEVVGVDWRVPLDVAAARVGPDRALQGNLDPAVLFAPWPVIERRVEETLRLGAAAAGYVFNLGHGVHPDTDPDVLARVVELVHCWRAEPSS
ncbi:MAG: uroporphyrinogen decarboxylase family protein, partial [Mycobacteriales bacterium]